MIDLILALIIDFIVGDPPNWPHPVRLMGNIISLEDRIVRRVAKGKRGLVAGGFMIVAVNIAGAFLIPFYILKLAKPYFYIYHAINVYLLYTCVASKCLHIEAIKIYKALSIGIEEARYRLSFIVGRDTKHLDEGEIIRATVETVAENTADGVIAPIFYGIIGGAPLAIAYKMVNTMDSMLGYMNEKHRYIGYFPAKTDDVFNFIPARLTGCLMAASSIFRFNVLNGVKVMFRDRKNHKSPNCAYPEGAAAGLLNVQLGGTNLYFGEVVEKPTIGDKAREINKEDIKKTIEIMYRAEIMLAMIYILVSSQLV